MAAQNKSHHVAKHFTKSPQNPNKKPEKTIRPEQNRGESVYYPFISNN
ncbi:hypothetical protein A11S_2335 [Micavibrio aeruginosavorus EPB]|uniref:Uncharacterized protein n=1 Tax=Micavibrio aeruginosavorus EPB TaxID=349215 RepID=M4VKV1_9BACT|nr:hypothetical protein A11S_2335 [Micavibrio aeruginosavorus EPB]